MTQSLSEQVRPVRLTLGATRSSPSADELLASLAKFTFQWHVTERCNLRCAHCYQESYSGPELSFGQWLEVLSQLEELIEDWRRVRPGHPRIHLTLTGGEPFVHPDFPRLLQEIARRRDQLGFAVLCNGHFIDDATASELAQLGTRYVQVSLEGTKATHDRIRGRGSFDRVVLAVQKLRKARVPVMVSFTGHRGNFREFPEVAKMACAWGVKRLWSDRVIPSGSALRGATESLTPEETREYVLLMRKAGDAACRRWWNKTQVAQHRALQFLGGAGPVYRCVAGESLLALLPNGDLLPCRRMPIKIGNILETPLRELYGKHPVLRVLRDPQATISGCEGCALQSLCRGGLRCLAFAVHKDPFRSDPGCWLGTNLGATRSVFEVRSHPSSAVVQASQDCGPERCGAS